MMQGKLTGISVRPGHGVPVIEKQRVEVFASAGLAGDHRARPGKRQVTVLTEAGWQAACRELDQALPWTLRRANLLISGLELGAGDVGKQLVIGDLTLQITGETDPCRFMDDAAPGLRKALEPGWRGGVTCKVISAGEVAIGAPVTLAA